MRTAHLPTTDSIKELAEFWDHHDLTDFENQLEEVTVPVFERSPRDEVVEVRLHAREVETVAQIAKARGVATTTLLHDWIVEKLRE